MLLAIDVGNSNIVIGYMKNDEIIHVSRIATDTKKTEDEYAVMLKQLTDFYHIDATKIEGVIICSVVPHVTGIFKEAVRRAIGLQAIVVGAGVKTGLNIAIDNPAQLGSDLVADGVAAVAFYKTPVIVFDMGTATTISVIGHNASYLGGAIFPGLRLSLNALSSHTAQLPTVPIEAPRNCIGTNTIDCMKSGSIFGTASMVDGMIQRIEDELGEKASVVATGGLASSIVPYCKRDICYDENLLLRGLNIIYLKNRKKKA
ncbi:MAG: type pantothenate kinase [Oscillospiraceae bacterium]|nr:type pantothenate kinase [Oscillospiraceae bacterium]